MKTIKKSTPIILSITAVLLFLTFGTGCRDSDEITPTPVNLNEHFRYSLDGGSTYKEIDLNQVTAKYRPDPNGIESFNIVIIPAASTNLVEKLTATFYLQNFGSFISSSPNQTNYLWGIPGFDTRSTTSNTFFFSDITRPVIFNVGAFINNQITTTVTEYPTTVNSPTEGYIAFTFSGTYVVDQNNPLITGSIMGSARIKRTE
ncbi:hypothetical protein [Polaribacter glomeratus]|uniref:Uncharacterized protein n=1 Tax=Polaribacter glomeratus TaxID=102 RepID=A0A2S7WW07_9FLAO|nr:hypothetical protein [Polaribacter glomeratus]PQJ81783.1 hypothetical protein BTO16_04000 [Polaribacter glomeratus]TXD66294.1 hypothetical protein ESX12_05770 [Polaribacter glomeratus]